MSDVLTRRDALRAGLAGAGLAGAGCTGRGAITVEEGFEDDDFAAAWTTDAAIGPEVPVADFEWQVRRSREQAHGGEWSLRVFTGGRHDDGTAWAVREIPIRRGARYAASVAVSAWSESESFNTRRHLVARLGRDPPTAEADFPDPGVNTTSIEDAPVGGLREPLDLATGWRRYRFDWSTPRLETDVLYLAVGVSVVWETDAVNYVDDVAVELVPG